MAYVRSSDPISNIEPDEGSEVDNDSAFNGSAIAFLRLGSASYQTSISSSVKNYKYENGRRYHAFREGEYVLPNDEEEQDRMDLGHHIYLLLLKGKLYRAPLPPNPQRVLDLGTGTGIWAIDFAEVPANCVFEVDDYESPWPYSQNFDFIHGRELLGFVGDFDRLFAQAMKNLKPGGYLEMQTAEAQAFSDDGTMEKAVNCLKWVAELRGASEKFGKSMSCVDTWEERMRNAGFVDVTRDVFKVRNMFFFS
ncbi:MAG: hypothetical protein M1834_005418 [Cirrosporium novae-zelandiae]|nr:MAG: hypothetical protein M1834_005418 [Cirrosporium novae-zelandiae]